jgi:hypothetical protein
MKTCNRCNIEKPLSEFTMRKKTYGDKKGLIPYYMCAICKKEFEKEQYQIPERQEQIKRTARRSYIKRTYGISLEEYDDMILSQDSKCAICKKSLIDLSGREIHIDHCHESGKIRGILCSHCNVGIGNLNDDIAILKSAIQYLSLERN